MVPARKMTTSVRILIRTPGVLRWVGSRNRHQGHVDSLLDPYVKTEIEVVDAEPVERPLDDRTGTNQGRNRDPDDPLGGDHALLSAGGAWEKATRDRRHRSPGSDGGRARR